MRVTQQLTKRQREYLTEEQREYISHINQRLNTPRYHNKLLLTGKYSYKELTAYKKVLARVLHTSYYRHTLKEFLNVNIKVLYRELEKIEQGQLTT